MKAQRVIRLSFGLLVALAVGACGGLPTATGSAPPPAPSRSPDTSVDPSGGSTIDPPPSPSTPASNRVPVGQAPIDPSTPTACFGLETGDCLRARGLAAAVLTAADPRVVYVQVGPFGCPIGGGCPNTLLARPAGDVTLEFGVGEPITVHLELGAGVKATRSEASGILVAPSSAPSPGGGPFEFSLGHCGLFSGIDFDGAWWDPVGPVAAEHSDSINAAKGTITVADLGRATFRSDGGLIVQLVRRDGPKFLPMCD